MVAIGEEFGNRHYSTIIYTIQKVQKMMEKDRKVKEIIDDTIKISVTDRLNYLTYFQHSINILQPDVEKFTKKYFCQQKQTNRKNLLFMLFSVSMRNLTAF